MFTMYLVSPKGYFVHSISAITLPNDSARGNHDVTLHRACSPSARLSILLDRSSSIESHPFHPQSNTAHKSILRYPHAFTICTRACGERVRAKTMVRCCASYRAQVLRSACRTSAGHAPHPRERVNF